MVEQSKVELQTGKTLLSNILGVHGGTKEIATNFQHLLPKFWYQLFELLLCHLHSIRGFCKNLTSKWHFFSYFPGF